ncbi:MAG: hypothetical protein H6701_02150 [Myxococcales bacterium]|nr:hypothetical protein [Myxococcales bacterium]MCB9551336.1 hypothetical protein [Myxococcales bacterium]
MSDENNPYLLYPDHSLDRRPRYYDGQFLRSGDFIDAQRYVIDRHRRHLEGSVSAGVVSGLDVTAATDRVTVAPGAAVDGRGRPIVLVAATEKAIAAADRGKNLTLYVAYAEVASDESEGEQGTTGYTRFHEMPSIAYVVVGAALPADAVVLARLSVDAAGGVVADGSVRPRAGLRLPGATPLTMAASDADPGRATLAGALRLTVPDGTAHSPAAPALRVDGHGMVTGGLVVGQDGTTGYQGIANAGDDLVVAGRLAAAGSEGSAIYKLGVGLAAPTQGEGTLVAQRAGIGRGDVGAGLALDVTGAARVSGAATIGGAASAAALTVGDAATVGGALTVDGVTTLRNSVGIGSTLAVGTDATVGATLTVTGAATYRRDVTVEGSVLAQGRQLDLGHGIANRTNHAGKITYGVFDNTALCIIGVGTNYTDRRVRIWSEAGTTVGGPLSATGAVTAPSVDAYGELRGGTVVSEGAATVQGDLDTLGNGTVRGRLVVGQTSATGYGGVTADVNDLVVNGQFAAGGSAGAAMYSLAVGANAMNGREGWMLVRNRLGVGSASEPTRALDVDGSARVTGATDIGGALSVSGAATLQSSVAVGGRLTVAAGDANGIRFPDNVYGGSGDWAGLRYWRPADTGESARLELAVGNDADDALILKQKNVDLMVLRNGKVGIGIGDAEPTQTLQVGGHAQVDGWLRLNGKVIDLSNWDTSAQSNCGQIKYRVHTDDSLELLGARPTGSDGRRIKAWAEGGFEVVGHITIGGQPVARSVNSSVRIVWGAVKSNGTKWCGEGFTSSVYQGNSGVFQIDFTPDFSARPCVIAVQHYPNDDDGSNSWGNTRDNAIVSRVYNSWAQIVTGNGDGNRTARSFEFIAIGPA